MNPHGNPLLCSMGGKGLVYRSDTTATPGPFHTIYCITACAFSALTITDATGNVLTGLTLTPGQAIYGRISTFTLSSGSVVAYLE